MLEVGWSEILVIAIVLIVIVGPKDLPKMLRTFGTTMRKMRAMAGDFQHQFNEALKEAELDEVRKTIDDVRGLNPRNAIRDALDPLRQVGEDVRRELNKSDADIRAKAAALDAQPKAETAPVPAPVAPIAVPPATVALAPGMPKGLIPETPDVSGPATRPRTAAKAKTADKTAAKTADKTAAKPRVRGYDVDSGLAAARQAEIAATVPQPQKAVRGPATGTGTKGRPKAGTNGKAST